MVELQCIAGGFSLMVHDLIQVDTITMDNFFIHCRISENLLHKIWDVIFIHASSEEEIGSDQFQ